MDSFKFIFTLLVVYGISLLAALGMLVWQSLVDAKKEGNKILPVFWIVIFAIGFSLFFYLGDIVRLYITMF